MPDPGLTKEEAKQAFKEAMKEWLDEKFIAFGKWSALSLAAAALMAMLYFILRANGWGPIAPR